MCVVPPSLKFDKNLKHEPHKRVFGGEAVYSGVHRSTRGGLRFIRYREPLPGLTARTDRYREASVPAETDPRPVAQGPLPARKPRTQTFSLFFSFRATKASAASPSLSVPPASF